MHSPHHSYVLGLEGALITVHSEQVGILEGVHSMLLCGTVQGQDSHPCYPKVSTVSQLLLTNLANGARGRTGSTLVCHFLISWRVVRGLGFFLCGGGPSLATGFLLNSGLGHFLAAAGGQEATYLGTGGGVEGEGVSPWTCLAITTGTSVSLIVSVVTVGNSSRLGLYTLLSAGEGTGKSSTIPSSNGLWGGVWVAVGVEGVAGVSSGSGSSVASKLARISPIDSVAGGGPTGKLVLIQSNPLSISGNSPPGRVGSSSCQLAIRRGLISVSNGTWLTEDLNLSA